MTTLITAAKETNWYMVIEEDFHGETKGLETTDTWITKVRDRLGSDASQLLSRMAMVKLTSKEPSEESVLIVSWQGSHKLTYKGKLLESHCLSR